MREKVLLSLLGLGLGCMLITSLYQRFAHPELTVSRLTEARSAKMPEAVENMGLIGSLMDAVAKNPQDRDALLKLTENLMAAGEWQAAENFAQRLVALEGGSQTRPLYLLAVIHHNQGRHAQAAEILEKLLSEQENPSARYSLAVLYLHFLDKRTAGVEQLRKGLAIPNLSQSLAAAMREELARAEAVPSVGRDAGELEKER